MTISINITYFLTSLLIAGIFLIGFPTTSYARHSGSINTNRLDDDIVEEIPIPILFGLELAEIVPDFGDSRGGGTRSHEGQDMHSFQGMPVVSPTEAIVTSTGSGASAGNYVYTANPGGENFRYMHLDSIAKIKRGDLLKQGDLIGTVGDTGNAPDGVFHLHFEIRDGKTPIDPYERLVDGFSLIDKISFLDDVLDDAKDDDAVIVLLVAHFANDFRTALNEDYDLPREIEIALEKNGVVSQTALQKKLQTLLQKIPALLTMELEKGDSGGAVALLQLYLIYSSEGAARDSLVVAGATGYFGPVTAAAVAEFQTQKGEQVTGAYNAGTRTAMLKV